MKEKAKKYLKEYFGYNEFRPFQYEAIDSLMKGKDVILVMPTGMGKSLCFQLPALLSGKTTIVISPLISLMKDQVDSLVQKGISAASANSSFNYQQNKHIINNCKENGLNLLYLSPERLLSDFSLLTKLNFGFFAIDEAHCISSWGHDFRPEYTRLKKIRELYPEIPIIALTATADKITRKDIAIQLGLNNPNVFVASFDRPNLSLNVNSGYNATEKRNEIAHFINARPGQSGIIYCLSRKETEKIADYLNNKGINCTYYHAGMDSLCRQKVQENFINDKIPVICATIAFGLGIHKPDIRWVIHNNLPRNIESYYQEIGRAGRDGMPAETVLYYNTGDVFRLRQFAEESGQKALNLEKLKRMHQYAEADVCRRRILISYFGEDFHEDCGNCDVCRNPPEHFDATILAQKAISALIRMGEKSGTIMLTDVLRGSAKTEILEKGFNLLKTYGTGRSTSYHDWHAYLLQMLNLGVFEIAYDEGFSLKVTKYGKDIVFGRQKIYLVKPDPHKSFYDPDEPFGLSDNSGSDMFDGKCLKNNRTILQASEKHTKYPKRIKGATYNITLDLLKNGLTVEEIAHKRSLKPSTIYSHMIYLINNGKTFNFLNYITYKEIERINNARLNIGEDAGINAISEILKNDVPIHLIGLGICILNNDMAPKIVC